MNTAPASRRPRLLRRALAALLTQLPDPMTGQFKACFAITIDGVNYAIKRGATDHEIRKYHITGDGDVHGWRHRKSNRNADMLREIVAQCTKAVPRSGIVPYVAWGYNGGWLWGLQPWADTDSDDYEGEYPSSFSGDDAPCNRGFYNGDYRCIDWGYCVDWRRFRGTNRRRLRAH